MKILRVLIFILIAIPVLGQEYLVHTTRDLYSAGDIIDGVIHRSTIGNRLNIYIKLVDQNQNVLSASVVDLEGSTCTFQVALSDSLDGIYELQVALSSIEETVFRKHLLVIPNRVSENLIPLDKRDQTTFFEAEITHHRGDKNFRAFIEPLGEDSLELIIENPNELESIASISVTDFSQNLPPNFLKPSPGCSTLTPESQGNSGFTITGHVVDKETLDVVPYQDVFLRIMGDDFKLVEMRSDRMGNFEFKRLKLNENAPVYVSSFNDDIELIVDIPEYRATDFCPLRLVDSLGIHRLLNFLTVVDKVEDSYHSNPSNLLDQINFKSAIPADYTVDIHDIIALGSVKEVLKEAVPNAYVRKGKIKVFSEDNRRTFDGYPLLLINGIPIRNDSLVFALNVRKLEKILVGNTYHTLSKIGNMARYGVVAFYTSDPNLPVGQSNAARIDIGFLESRPFIIDSHESGPYMPSVLLWKPRVGLSSEELRFRFKRSDYSTNLVLSMRAFSNDGKPINHDQIFTLR